VATIHPTTCSLSHKLQQPLIEPSVTATALLLVVATSVPGLLLMSFDHQTVMSSTVCSSSGTISASSLRQGLAFSWRWLDFLHCVQHTLVMILAMAPALLLRPVSRMARMTPEKGARLIVIFVVAYVGVWLPAGVLLMLMAVPIETLFRSHHAIALLVGVLMALAWGMTPTRRHCMTACATSGGTAPSAGVWSGLRAGAREGLFCIGACGFFMLIPLIGGQGHGLLMAIVMLGLALERIIVPLVPSGALHVHHRNPNPIEA
jgi:predicted metal-binding membrane protein